MESGKVSGSKIETLRSKKTIFWLEAEFERKMLFTVDNYTYETITERNSAQNGGHMSKSGKLFRIFPFYLVIPVKRSDFRVSKTFLA